ncbi:DUF1292 domain-containing protein [Alicyclobacillus sp. ALC3]|uniref:DUF1292 domain-containing protein n=1 Tax=Alicyclobacillus sp. ALC3 TaxID=2796143 RepID=UPI0023781963|nr:DUF1292 domain-containing protein [Alicyclobacillus sp. ALC3]WDL97470.1 DUF1292 domain-containing protein [Alicyclobacillus sp. ALC3]
MAWTQPRLAFPNAKQYAFLYEDAHLLLLSWERDDAKFLFRIVEQKDGELLLDYPGQKFTDTILDNIQGIFLIQVQESDKESRTYALGSYFVIGKRKYGAYYDRESDSEAPEVVLFRIAGEAPNYELQVPEDAEYEQVAAAFVEQHEEMMRIMPTEEH